MTIEHKTAIEMIIHDAKKHKYILGVILIGSLAKNTGNKDSDVDLIVVVDDDEFNKRKFEKNYFCGTIFDKSKYSVYIDGKIVNKKYLEILWTEGSHSAKNTFSNVELLYSKDSAIEDLLKKVDKKNYCKEENIRKFYSLMKSYKFKADDDIENIIQVKHSIFYSVFFACRLVLEHNNIYYPCIKNMENELKNCKEKPNEFLEKMHKVLTTLSIKELEKFYETTEEYFKEYRFDDNIRKGYVIENEDYWFFNVRPYSEI
jgi:predicted nucleotidyltransferase